VKIACFLPIASSQNSKMQLTLRNNLNSESMVSGWSVEMTYFSLKDHQALTYNAEHNAVGDSSVQRVYNKFQELNKALHRRLRDHNYDLHPHWEDAEAVSSRSCTCLTESEALVLPYFRSKEQAQLVERLMGRENTEWRSAIEVYRHPVIELRLTQNYFAVELVASPQAWWDQQNFVGKLAIPRHRETFRSILQRINGDYCFGFWDGIDLSDMHLTTQQLVRGNHLNEWMSTFCEGQDWLRVGAWYVPQDPSLDAGRIVNELTQRIGSLYHVYNFILWTSNNDFHSFYRKSLSKSSGMHLS
jgi:hypothetical protein